MPEKAELGLPGADSSGAEVWKYLHGTRDLQVALEFVQLTISEFVP